MKLLDTAIFIYAQGGPHRYYEPCRTIVTQLATDSSDYTIDTEQLQEVLHVYGHRGERDRTFRTFDRIIKLFPQPIPMAAEEVSVAREILERYPVLSPRDASHAAVVSTQRLEGIFTTDAGFSRVQGLSVYDLSALVAEPSC